MLKRIAKEVLFGREPEHEENQVVSVSESDLSTATTPTTDVNQLASCVDEITITKIENPVAVPVKKTPVIEEVIKPVERDVIQPVIHREREQTEVHQIIQPILESEIKPTEITREVLPATAFPASIADSSQFKADYKEGAERYHTSVVVAPLQKETVIKPPIIEETIKKVVVEEIQPVIYREIIEPHLVQKVQPVYEKVVEEPVLVKETRAAIVRPVIVDSNENLEKEKLITEDKINTCLKSSTSTLTTEPATK